ncbi:MAG: pilus assembly FimT family protein [Thermoguttaceae bacterium]
MTSKRGMTLVELLVVVAIMMLLVAVGIPMLRPMLEKQSQAQGAQVLRVMLLRARNMAVEKEQPFGLRIERYNDPTGTPTEAAVRLSIVREQPPTAGIAGPTAGGDWRVAIGADGAPTFYDPYSGTWTPASTTPPTPTAQDNLRAEFIEAFGDRARIQFWGSGEEFEVFVNGTNLRFVNRAAMGTASDADVRIVWDFDTSTVALTPTSLKEWDAYRAIRRGLTATEGGQFPPYYQSTTTGTTITSSPAPVVLVVNTPPWIPTSSPPVLLPEGVCVDLEYSGIGKSGDGFKNTPSDVIVWFSADGSLQRVDFAGGQDKCDGLLHFLIGSWEQVTPNRGVLGEDTSTNLELPANIWVTVEPRSARVLVNEIKVPNGDDVGTSREFANKIWEEVAAPR